MNFRTRTFLATLFFSVVSLGIFLGIPSVSLAATLYIDPSSVDVLKGDTVTVAVRLNTDEGECVNTVDAVLSYSEGIQVIDVSRGRSILPLWVEEPVIDKSTRKITFAGGIPNGYCGRVPGDPSLTNILAELVFRSPGFSVGKAQDTSAIIKFEPESRVLLNDGLGTQAQLKTIPSTINLLQQVGTTSQDAWRDEVGGDVVPPQPFSIDLVQNPDVFSGKYYIVFNTSDKQSGIDHYEVIEEPRSDIYAFRWGRADAPWIKTKSPYVLKDQSLSSIIRVKAIDKAGHDRISVLIPDDTQRRLGVLTWILIGAGLAVCVLCLGIMAWWLFYLRRRNKADRMHMQE